MGEPALNREGTIVTETQHKTAPLTGFDNFHEAASNRLEHGVVARP